LSSFQSVTVQAQDPDRNLILASDLVNTTLNGAMLGSAVMGLQNSTNYKDPLRVGVGLGMLAGVGLATFDLVQVENGRDLVHGTFISGNNSSVVLLIDTIYGAVAGSVIGTAIILVANEPLTDGLQYGASLGGWLGFGFGLVDTFILSRNRTMSPLGGSFDSDFASVEVGSTSNSLRSASSISRDSAVQLGFLQPDLTHIVTFETGSFSGGQVVPKPVLNLLELKIRF
jgi:hypothetical protein